MRKALFILFLLVSTGSNAQKETPKFTFNVELGLPVALRNAPFDDFMQGLVSASTYGQYEIQFNINFGLGVKYGYFTVNEFAVPEPVFGGVHTGVVFGKIGWGKFHNPRFATDIGLKVGYAQNYYDTDVNREMGINPIVQSTVNTELIGSLILTADERNSYRWIIGYGSFGKGFNPGDIGIQSNEGYDPAEFAIRTQYLIVGFGYTYYFGVKSSD